MSLMEISSKISAGTGSIYGKKISIATSHNMYTHTHNTHTLRWIFGKLKNSLNLTFQRICSQLWDIQTFLRKDAKFIKQKGKKMN